MLASVSGALARPEQWCEVLILHLNTKYCRAANDVSPPQLDLRLGKKFDQPLSAATAVRFAFRTVSSTPDYLAVEMQAPDGPFDTRDYRIVLEATPLDGGRTFIHMGYSFTYGTMSRIAMQVYLSTIARDKVRVVVEHRTVTDDHLVLRRGFDLLGNLRVQNPRLRIQGRFFVDGKWAASCHFLHDVLEERSLFQCCHGPFSS